MKIKVTASVDRLGATTKRILSEVGEKVGLEEVVVTSTLRTPLAQAEAMLANIEAGRYIIYKWAGEQVQTIARTMRGERAKREDILKAMVAKIEQLAKMGIKGRVSKHCVSEEEYDDCNIIDVSFWSMGDKAQPFLKEMIARKEVEKVIQPIDKKMVGYDAAEPAFHFEIKQA